MSLLDTILGNFSGQGAARGSLEELLKSQGGLGGLITKFGQNGLSDAAASWIGKGQNQSLSPEQISTVLGSGPVARFAESLGVSPDQAGQLLAQVLPQLIDHMTPKGRLSPADSPIDDVLDSLPGGLGGALGGALGSLLKR